MEITLFHKRERIHFRKRFSLHSWRRLASSRVQQHGHQPRYRQDRFEPRNLLPLSLSYDHRIIDGADAARFLGWICESLEQPLNLFLE